MSSSGESAALDVEEVHNEAEVHSEERIQIQGEASQNSITNISRDVVLRLWGQNSARLSFVDKTPSRIKSSDYWKNFQVVQVDLVAVDYVKCKLCNTIYTWNKKSGTSNLKNHSCPRSDVAGHTTKVHHKDGAKDSNQTKITSFSKKCVPIKSIDELNECIVVGLAKDLKPLGTVEARGFRSIAQALVNFGATHGRQEISNILQHRTTLKRKHLPNIVTEKQDSVRRALKTTSSYPKFSFTLDMWSDKYQQRQFLSLSIHFIDEEWILRNYMMAVEEFEEAYKSTENIRSHVLRIISKYFSEEQGEEIMSASFAVTDGGSNMINIFDQRLPCMCHRLNLIVQWTLNQKQIPPLDKIQERIAKGNPISEKKLFNLQTQCPKIKDVLGNLKKLVEYFKKAGLNSNLPISLKQDVDTRWNSQLMMLESYNRSSQEVKKILLEKKNLDKVKNIHDDVVSQLIKFLKPLSECSDVFSSDKTPTFHSIVLWHHNMQEHLKVTDEDSNEIKNLKTQSQKCLAEYWTPEPIYYAACMLDPKYRKLKFVAESTRQQALDLLRNFMAGEHNSCPELQESTSTDTPSTQPSAPKKGRFSQLEDSDEEIKEIDELDSYLMYSFKNPFPLNSDGTVDVLRFWRGATEFPILRKVAKWLLAIPASQASDERVFSSTGSTLSARRTELSGTTLSQLTFIHKNC